MADAVTSGDGSREATRVHYGPGPLQFGELSVPPGVERHPVMLLIHGGFWRNTFGLDVLRPLAAALVDRGFVVWNVEYRRAGDPGGGWPGTLQDVAAAADYLRDLAASYPLDLGRVVPIGHSAGGQLALWLAARHRLTAARSAELGGAPAFVPAAAISLAGVVNLDTGWQRNLGGGAVENFLGGSPDALPERYAAASPAALLPLGVPQVLVHGSADDVVPLDLSERYVEHAAADGDRVRLRVLPGVDHMAVIDPASGAWAVALEELDVLQSRADAP